MPVPTDLATETAPGTQSSAWDDDACLYLLWRLHFSADGDHAMCRKCGRVRRFHRLRRRRAFVCDACGLQIYPTTGTIFARSTTSLMTWFEAVALVVGTETRLSASQLAGQLGVPPTTANRLLRRIRHVFASRDRDERLLRQIAKAYRQEPDLWVARLGASTRMNGDAELRRDAICAAACATIARNGLSATRIQDIAEAADISTATVHYYFPSKDDVLIAALRWAGTRIDASLREGEDDQESALARLARVLELALPTEGILKDEYRLWLEIWSRARHKPELVSECDAISAAWSRSVREILRAGIDTGEFHAVAPVDEVVERIIAIANGLGFKVVVGYPGLDVARMRELMIRFTAEQLAISVDDLQALAQPLTLR